MGKYANAQTNRTVANAGCVTLSLTDGNSTQLASHPCRKMGIIVANADDVKFSIDAAVSTANFCYLPQLSATDGDPLGDNYLILEIENTNMVRVLGENSDVVYYWYLAG